MGHEIRAVCFDFGNVIAFFDHFRAMRRLAPRGSLSEHDLYKLMYANALEDDYEAGRISTAEYVAEAMAAGNLNCTEAEFLAGFVDIFTPNEPMGALVERLAGRYRILLASNTNPAHAEQFRQQLAPTLRHFDDLVLSYEVGWRKPRRPYFAALVERAGVPARQCLFIDDLPANVFAAQAAGLQAILYTGDDGEFQGRLGMFGIEPLVA